VGNYRQHLTFAGSLGVVYGAAAYFVAGVHWVYGSVVILLTTMSGLLPDLDSPSGVELKSFSGILGVLVAVAAWNELGNVHPTPAFEFQLWAVVCSYVMVRHGLRRIMGRVTVHRGMSHSFPTCAVWGALTFLYYPTGYPLLRAIMALAVMIGFLSHLLLDEICSVDLQGARVNKAFGTAMKFWAPSPWSTLAVYGALSFLTWKVIKTWPDGPFPMDPPVDPALPHIPLDLPKQLSALDSYFSTKH
jgi:membrane-bound metal-dependent hydrolase YbcI (DUF457 family)